MRTSTRKPVTWFIQANGFWSILLRNADLLHRCAEIMPPAELALVGEEINEAVGACDRDFIAFVAVKIARGQIERESAQLRIPQMFPVARQRTDAFVIGRSHDLPGARPAVELRDRESVDVAALGGNRHDTSTPCGKSEAGNAASEWGKIVSVSSQVMISVQRNPPRHNGGCGAVACRGGRHNDESALEILGKRLITKVILIVGGGGGMGYLGIL